MKNKDITGIKYFFWKYPWRYILLNKIRNKKEGLKLNLGAGKNPIQGWINADLEPKDWSVLYIDVTKKLPFKDSSLDYIVSEHLIEHLSKEEGLAFLKECRRVIKKGGKIRLSSPDLIFISSLYKGDKKSKYYIKKITDRFLNDSCGRDYRPVFVINNAFYNWGHKFLYDEKLLIETFKKAGFKKIKKQDYGKSQDKNLDGIESHEKGVGDVKVCQMESIVLEGTK